MWSWLIGKRKVKTPQEMISECQEDLAIAQIQMKRTIEDMERDDRQSVEQARKLMKDGKKKQALMVAKQTVRFRGATQRMIGMVGRMKEVSINIQLMQSTHEMQRAMLGLTRAMSKINRKFNVSKMASIMKHFEKESYKMDMTQDIMNDTMDETMAQYDDDEAESELFAQIMDEIGIDIEEQLINVPKTQHQHLQSTAVKDEMDTDNIMKRLQNLRNDTQNNDNNTI